MKYRYDLNCVLSVFRAGLFPCKLLLRLYVCVVFLILYVLSVILSRKIIHRVNYNAFEDNNVG